MITNHRGGFCYELNGLFGALLCQLGFDVRLISARVFGKEKKVCTLATVNGRATLRDHAFIETINGHKMVTPVVGEKEFVQILKDRFGIEIS